MSVPKADTCIGKIGHFHRCNGSVKTLDGSMLSREKRATAQELFVASVGIRCASICAECVARVHAALNTVVVHVMC